jgi:probable biosynthetic protein (TIGR04098 family)
VRHDSFDVAALRGGLRAAEPEGRTHCAPTLPEVPRQVRLGMPHLDAGGLSENWLFRQAGALQWEAIGQRLGVRPDALRDAAGVRLYPTVVAVRARYDAPLAAFAEDDTLAFAVEVVPCGRACAQGRIVAAAGGRRLSLDVLTSFAARGPHGLRTTHLAPSLAQHWAFAGGAEPAIAALARAARRGHAVDDPFSGPILATQGPALGELTYQPSPWADYNGAGLLYFASYVTIADTAARQLLRGRQHHDQDWALATSPVRRDVYYYDNLPLGAALTATLRLYDSDGTGVLTHVRLSRADDGRPMADVIARRAFVRAAGRKAP